MHENLLPGQSRFSLITQSGKNITMHRYIARFIGCIILGIVFSIPTFLASRGSGLAPVGKKQITVRTDGTTSDVIAAIESLERKDLTIRATDKPVTLHPISMPIVAALTMTGMLWIACGVVKRVEESLSSPKKNALNQ